MCGGRGSGRGVKDSEQKLLSENTTASRAEQRRGEERRGEERRGQTVRSDFRRSGCVCGQSEPV